MQRLLLAGLLVLLVAPQCLAQGTARITITKTGVGPGNLGASFRVTRPRPAGLPSSRPNPYEPISFEIDLLDDGGIDSTSVISEPVTLTVPAGTYRIVETPLNPEAEAEMPRCTGTGIRRTHVNNRGGRPRAQVIVQLNPGEEVRCMFTNRITGEQGISLETSADKQRVRVSGRVTYQLKVTNGSAQAVDNLVLRANIATSGTYTPRWSRIGSPTRPRPDDCSLTSGGRYGTENSVPAFRCNIGALGSGESKTVHIKMDVNDRPSATPFTLKSNVTRPDGQTIDGADVSVEIWSFSIDSAGAFPDEVGLAGTALASTGNLQVTLDGVPQWPLRLKFSHHGDCPERLSCHSETREIRRTRAPITLTGVVWCEGAGGNPRSARETGDIPLNYKVELTDASGVAANAHVRFTCKTGERSDFRITRLEHPGELQVQSDLIAAAGDLKIHYDGPINYPVRVEIDSVGCPDNHICVSHRGRIANGRSPVFRPGQVRCKVFSVDELRRAGPTAVGYRVKLVDTTGLIQEKDYQLVCWAAPETEVPRDCRPCRCANPTQCMVCVEQKLNQGC